MPIVNIVKTSEIKRSARVQQLEGIFDVPPSEKSQVSWSVDLPIDTFDWNIGLIVGASGSGKSTIARHLFGEHIIHGFEWSGDRSIVDDFPKSLSIKEISGLLSSVGFSSPPSWLRPFHVLSNGEQFRVTMARALAEFPDLAVIDEFTSVVDRQVAQVGSAAIAKAVRQRKQKLIAVTCHYDVIDWLQPDWVYEPATGQLARGSLQRPPIRLEIKRVHHSAWVLFRRYHYLDSNINTSAHCYVAFYRDTPVAFTSVLNFPGKQSRWRMHRTVCLPDYQGVGIGSRLNDFMAGVYRATGKPVSASTANPAMVRHRAKSPYWNLKQNMGLQKTTKGSAKRGALADPKKTLSFERLKASNRLTASFEYVGPRWTEAAKGFGLI